MDKRRAVLIPLGLALIALILTVVYLYRPITISIDGKEVGQLHAPAWTVGQALYNTQISLVMEDQVTPALDQPIPMDGKIQIQRAVQLIVWEDGQIRTLSGVDRSPAALLSQNGIELFPDDRLLHNGLPVDPSLPLTPGQPVILQLVRAQPVSVVVNGEEQTVLAEGPSSAHALWQAGARIGPGDLVSAEPGAPLLQDDVLAYQAASPLQIQVGGQIIRTRSSANTVGQALAEAGIALQGLDYSQPAESDPLPADGQVRVVRVREEITLTEELLPFGSTTMPDPNVELDQRSTISAGQYGVKVVRERARYEDGQETSRAFDSDWVASEPQDQTVGYGTMIVPKTADTPDGQIEYYRAVQVFATSYSPCRLGTADGSCGYTTASGLPLQKGVIGTSRAWFNLFRGQRVYVEGYGFAVFADWGAVGSYRIDLGFTDEEFESGAFVGWTTLYFLTPVPPNVPMVLP